MSVDAVSTFLAVGALLIGACLVATFVVRVVGLVSKRAANVYESIALSLDGQGIRLAFATATVAMLGSLYYSEIAGFIPCEYCWYQRIAMYPLVFVLGAALVTGEKKVRRYVLPLAFIGAGIALYHYGIQRFPDLAVGECSVIAPCTAAWVWKFDLVSIPFMAFVCFTGIITALLVDRSLSTGESAVAEAEASSEPMAMADHDPTPPPEPPSEEDQ
jgi:hypothetical protein